MSLEEVSASLKEIPEAPLLGKESTKEVPTRTSFSTTHSETDPDGSEKTADGAGTSKTEGRSDSAVSEGKRESSGEEPQEDVVFDEFGFVVEPDLNYKWKLYRRSYYDSLQKEHAQKFRAFLGMPSTDDSGGAEAGTSEAAGGSLRAQRKSIVQQAKQNFYSKITNTAADKWALVKEKFKSNGKGSKIREMYLDDKKKHNQLKKLIRLGIPLTPEGRGKVWLTVSGARRKLEEKGDNYYQEMLKIAEIEGDKEPYKKLIHQISLDIDRTFPGHVLFESEDGQQVLFNVLKAFVVRNPGIGYVQSMNFVAGMMLLFVEEDEAFWLLCTLAEDILPPDYWTATLVGVHADQRVFIDLLAEKLPKIHTQLENNNITLPMISMQWFMCLFIGTFPTELSLRVLDCVFMEGSKILLRVGLALMKYYEKEILESDSFATLYKLLLNAPKEVIDCDKLMKLAFDKMVVGSMASDMITAKRTHHRMSLAVEESVLTEIRKSRGISKRLSVTESPVAKELERMRAQSEEQDFELLSPQAELDRRDSMFPSPIPQPPIAVRTSRTPSTWASMQAHVVMKDNYM